ncbi:unnamed protein product [Acanthoscelides obtectus]|uniref:Uncharacterized protein n=1 Tax=Acanthoscelides obtectus TaxID=200917 RepID=A0A9P0KP42_ACAOB|nr:unnamed protein product [Acanthoscelides obtectus]CAK1623690.1 hypothetical protein AOBTE_LOCUS2121 [Acanthoscelides obtectus]
MFFRLFCPRPPYAMKRDPQEVQDLSPIFNVEVYPSSSSSKTWSASPATVTASENCYESDVFTESVQAKKKRKRFNMNASTESELKVREKQTKTTIGQLSNNKRT